MGNIRLAVRNRTVVLSLGSDRGPRASGAVNLPIIDLGAGDAEVSLGESSFPATPILSDSNHQTTLPGDLPIRYSWDLLSAHWACHQELGQSLWIKCADPSGWAQWTTSLMWVGSQTISQQRELNPSGRNPAGSRIRCD